MTTASTPKKTTRIRKTKKETTLPRHGKPVLGVVGNTLWILTHEAPTEREQTLTIDGFEKPFPIEWVEDRNAFLTELLMGYNLLENGAFAESDKKSLKGWAIDSVEGTLAGVDLADEWQLAGGHTAYLLAAENAPRPSFTVGQKIPVIAEVEYRFSGYFATQRAEGWVTLFCYDENDRVIDEQKIHIHNQPEYSGGTSLDNYALVESVFTPVSGTKYLQFNITLGEQIDLTLPNGYLFFTNLFLGIYEDDTESQFVKDYSVDAYRLNQAALEIKDSVFGKIDLPLFYEADHITIEYQNNVSKFDLDKNITSDYFRISIAKACKSKNWGIASKQLEKWLDADLSSKELHIFTQIDDFGIHKKGIFDTPTVDALILVRQLSENRSTDFQVWLLLAEVTYSLQRWKECATAYNTLKTLNYSFDDIDSIRFGETLAELHHYNDAFYLYLDCWTQSFENTLLNKCFDVVSQCGNLDLASKTLLRLFKIQKQNTEARELTIQIIPRLCVVSLANLLDQFGIDGCKLVLQSLPHILDNADITNDWEIPLKLIEALDNAKQLNKLPDWLAVECVWMNVQLEKLLIKGDKFFEHQYKQTLTRLKALSIWSAVVEFDKNFSLLDTDYLVYGQTQVHKSFESVRCLSDFLAHPESKSISPHILLRKNWHEQEQEQEQEQERLNQIRHVLIDFFRYSGDISEKTPNPNAYFDCDWYSENYLANNKEAHPLLHYLTHFEQKNVQPNYYFNNDYVRETQCLLSDEEPLSYYLKKLEKGGLDFCLTGFSPSPFFDRAFYLKHNDDLVHVVKDNSLEPLAHFIEHVSTEGRLAHAWQSYNEFVRHQRLYLEPFNQHTHFGTKNSFHYIKDKKAELAYFEGQKVLANQLFYKPLISILVPIYQVLPRFLGGALY